MRGVSSSRRARPAADRLLRMIPELQLQRMRVQVVLLFQVGLVIFSHIVVDQGDGHDQGQVAPPVMLNNIEQFLLFVRRQILLEIAQQVIQHVGVFFGVVFRRRLCSNNF